MKAHYAAVKVRLEANTKLLGKVNDSVLETSTGLPFAGSYVVLFGGSPDSLESNRFTAPQAIDSDAEYTYTVRSISTSAAAVRSLQVEVAAQMVGHRLVVTGRNCTMARLVDATDPMEDKATKPILFWADQEFSLYSYRA